MKTSRLISALLIIAISTLYSCENSGTGEESAEDTKNKTEEKATEEAKEEMGPASEETEMNKPDMDNDMTVTQEEAEAEEKAAENLKTNVKKLTFCDCVKKQKKIENLMVTAEEDAVMDSLLTEMENMKTGECDVLFKGSQASPEMRAERKAKIEACLN